MSNNNTHIREPLFHVVKRDAMPMKQAILVRTIAVLSALLLCGVVCILLVGKNPFNFYSEMMKGVVGSSRRIWKFSKSLALLLGFALAVTPAFRMKFWNIGAEGQVLVSCLACVACMFYIRDSVPNAVLILIMLVAAVFAGAVWAVLPAIAKALWNTNETLFTLMMNYVATYLVAYFLIVWEPDKSTLGELPYGHLPKIYHEYLLLIGVVALLTVAMYIYMKYSKHGYEIAVVGESQKTACYIGINVKNVIIRTMIVSGAVCGIVGFLIVGALDHSITTQTAGGLGFTAIIVSWLGKFNPAWMVLTSALVVFLDQGAAEAASTLGINNSFPSIVTGVIMFFIIGCEFFINYRVVFRKSSKEVK